MTAKPLSTESRNPPRYRRGTHRVALLATAFTLPLLFLGGSVTSYGVGMAVPDWPTTFGANMFLYNFWNAPFGVQVEHSHRLYGSAVGLATIVLNAWFFAFEPRKWVKGLGLLALAAVIAQGVMGGLRVSQISTTWAAFHGAFGQAFFGLMIALCVITSRGWIEFEAKKPDPANLRTWSIALLAMVYAQIAVGAWFRHFKTAPALWSHIVIAVAVLGLSHATAARVRKRGSDFPSLRPSTRAVSRASTLQVVLGLLALWLMLPLGGNPRPPSLWQAMLRTGHQTNGALLLAASVVLTLRSRHLLSPITRGAAIDPSRSTPDIPLRSLEAVA